METLVSTKKSKAQVGTATPLARKHKPNRLSGVVSSADMATAKYETMDIGPYAKYFGHVAKNFDMMLHGQPGAGKTFFLLKLANWLAENKGKVLFISTEEFGAVTLTNKINETKANSKNLFFAGSINGINFSDYDFVILDSVNDAGITLVTYKLLRTKHPNTAFILILQKTKEGTFRGGKEWEHEVEIAAELTVDKSTKKLKRFINTYKNRYGVFGTKQI